MREWGCFSYNGLAEPVRCFESVTAKFYIILLDGVLKRHLKTLKMKDRMFQQDGAASHRALKTKTWLKDSKVAVLEWPALSPDFNIIENIRGWIVRDIYANGKQYENLDELWEAIMRSMKDIHTNRKDQNRSLVNSVSDRLYDYHSNH